MKSFFMFNILLFAIWTLGLSQNQDTVVFAGITSGVSIGGSVTFTVGDLSSATLTHPSQSIEVGLLHCLPCSKENTNANITEDDWLPGVSVYPNPATHSLTLESSYPSHLKYVVFDANGKLVLTGELLGTKMLDLTSYANGLYILQMQGEDDGKIFFKKIVKE